MITYCCDVPDHVNYDQHIVDWLLRVFNEMEAHHGGYHSPEDRARHRRKREEIEAENEWIGLEYDQEQAEVDIAYESDWFCRIKNIIAADRATAWVETRL